MLYNVRKAYASKGDDVTISRFIKEPARSKPKQLVIPSLGHPVVEAGRSLFYRKGVKAPRPGLLVSGHSNVKIGRDVRKGHLKGYWIYTLSLEERATCPRSCSHWYDCFTPEARILLPDFTWVPIATIKVGDEVCAFAEKPEARGGGHRMTEIATVEKVGRAMQQCFEIETEAGKVTCSGGHLWLVKRGARTDFKWRKTVDLQEGDAIQYFADPWVQDLSYDAARLRGFMEGEGTCGVYDAAGNAKSRISWAQRPSKLCDEMEQVTQRLGFATSKDTKIAGAAQNLISSVHINGGWRECVSFLGRIRPTRMIEKAKDMWVDHSISGRGSRSKKVISIKPVGEKEVVTIQTSSRTMVVEGYFTHNCYGNNMPFAKRTDHRDHEALCAAIEADIAALTSVRGRRGILVRLHALGDFYSHEYVEFWMKMLAKYDRLAVYGYTARDPLSVIGVRIQRAKLRYGRRFAVRWSDGGLAHDCTVSINSGDQCPPNAFVCPEQTGRASHCATCAACWQGTKNVAFIDH